MLRILLSTVVLLQLVYGEPRVLVLGGNGFMGADTVELLLRYEYNVTIINRGSWYWDANDRIFPRVGHVNCDRNKGLNTCDAFKRYLREETEGVNFDAVIDFSAYRPGQVADSVPLIKDKTNIYILISTDSVYDVSKMKEDHLPYKENECERPEDKEEIEHYKHFTYGNNKLIAEEEIKASGVPYVILRLPDVIGPRDTTHRWWLYQVWLQLSAQYPHKPVGLPDFQKSYPISLVYSADVAEVIVRLIKDSEIQDQVFNLAWPETPTLRDVLEDMRHELGLSDKVPIVDWTGADRAFFLYPSGRRGPIDVQKAVEVLRFTPTPWKTAVRDTIAFYDAAMRSDKFRRQRDEIIQMVENEIMKDENKTKFYKTLEQMYGINLTHFDVTHDEL